MKQYRLLALDIPIREHQDGRMTSQRPRQRFGAFNPEANFIVFDSGYRGLRDSGKIGKRILTQFLQFTNDAHGFTHRNIHCFLGFLIIFHCAFALMVMRRHFFHPDEDLRTINLVYHPVLFVQSRRSEAFPLAAKRFVIESSYLS